MPADIWTEAAKMATSGLLVATVAIPVGLVARALRPKDEPSLPRWKPWRVPWGGFELTFAFLFVGFALPVFATDYIVTDPKWGLTSKEDQDKVIKRLTRQGLIRPGKDRVIYRPYSLPQAYATQSDAPGATKSEILERARCATCCALRFPCCC